MSNRTQALLRLLSIPIAYLAMIVIAFPLTIAAFLVFLVDIALQLVTGGDGLGADNIVGDTFEWIAEMREWLTFGE